ncbi:hypothetical protein FE257_008950 [Aspergillus nanangensis]|uniref:Uncharacterized protein n=1 Tax=Aspergillus nanangensis TaxID=2582783 RepID=A0AAD4CWG6_ASPNN|nr:hypothetical protein FE257_008950 [Aspergillus nanangensis]
MPNSQTALRNLLIRPALRRLRSVRLRMYLYPSRAWPGHSAQKAIYSTQSTQDWSMAVTARYQQYIEPYAPFLNTGEPLSELSLCFLAAAVMPNSSGGGVDDCPGGFCGRMALRYLRDVPLSAMTEEEVRAMLILCLRIPLNSSNGLYSASIVLKKINHGVIGAEPMDGEGLLSLSTCAAVTMTWKHFEDPAQFQNHCATTSSSIPVPPLASPHRNPLMQAFFHLTRILHQLLLLRKDGIKDSLEVESELLLWPARLSPSLSFVNRNMSSPESCLLHVLHNAVASWYYTSRLPDPQGLLEPNEATLSFLTTLGCSCVKTWKQHGRNFTDIWGNMYVMSIATVIRQICRLVRRFDCQNSRGVLILFLSDLSLHDVAVFGDQLMSEVVTAIGLPLFLGLEASQQKLREGLYGSPFEESDSNGATVYWMFRDMRNMTLRALRRGSTSK